MSSRLLNIATVIVFTMSSGAALACAGKSAKSTDGSQHSGTSMSKKAGAA